MLKGWSLLADERLAALTLLNPQKKPTKEARKKADINVGFF
jgi:hypothetical protein